MSNVNLALDELPSRQPSGTVEQGVLPEGALPHLRNFKLDNDKDVNLFPALQNQASGAGVALPSLKSINPSQNSIGVKPTLISLRNQQNPTSELQKIPKSVISNEIDDAYSHERS